MKLRLTQTHGGLNSVIVYDTHVLIGMQPQAQRQWYALILIL